MSEKIEENKKIEDLIVLKSIDIWIKKGEFVAIIGEVGSGKSSIISSLIGDMLYLDYDTYGEFSE